ncbi:MAG: aminodeoxychorismate synthase component I [Mycobacteriales bacterium]
MTGRLRVRRLGPGPGPGDVARRVAGRAYPVVLAGAWAGGGAVVACDPVQVAPAGADPFEVLARQPAVTGRGGVGGGWFGWIDYGGGGHLARYDRVLRWDGRDWYAESLGGEDWADDWLALAAPGPAPRRPYRLAPLTGPPSWRHCAAVERCVGAIRAGEVYQANICTRLTGAFTGSAADLFADLVDRLAPARAAYLATPDRTVVSLSPELFLRRTGRTVRTAPIKGTRPRRPGEDRVLAGSVKDRAENVMIVDLMRNDLGRVAAVGSVRVPTLTSVEPHAGVWHLVSAVEAELRAGATDTDLLRATFPPGSVTGCPKPAALRLIAELEDHPRGVYTGAIGYASPVAGLELSVAIRTFDIAGGRAVLGVGGGVTADSTPVEEWQECLDKARPLAPLDATLTGVTSDPDDHPDPAAGIFETLYVRDGEPVAAADHLARLRRACWEAYRLRLPDDLGLAAAAAPLAGPHRLRLDVTPDGRWRYTARPAPEPAGPEGLVLRLVTVPGGLWRHKYADRRAFEKAEADLAEGEYPLFVDEAGLLLETSRDSVFVVRDGGLLAPPLDGRILPGTTRARVLDLARDHGIPVRIRPVAATELVAATGLFVTNAVRGVRWVRAAGRYSWPAPDPLVSRLAALLRPDP